MDNPIIECQSLTKLYTRNNQAFNAVSDINLTIRRNETVLIKGRSGAGKSTLLNMMGGLVMPSSGKVLFKGTNLAEMKNNMLSSILLNEIGIIFQSFNLLPTYTIFENIEIALAPKKQNRELIKKEIMSHLEQFDLGDKYNLLPTQLSVGQQQKAAIVRTLIKQPSVIFADEPTGSVDTESASEILGYLIDLKNKRDITLILASHGNIPDKYADRLIILENGRISN
jgi:putative ABC transport system ATP-binding protein